MGDYRAGRRTGTGPLGALQELPRLSQLLAEFIRMETSGGILLAAATALAVIWANSPWAQTYFDLWNTKIAFGVGPHSLAKPLLKWINDGLMALFFLLVGLEIKREVLLGELSTLRQASLPLVAAVGGMVVPAAVFTAFNHGTPGAPGWGIPMATDIAFALGALMLLGTRVPTALKVFLTAFAVVDDIGALLVIAFFYTDNISWSALLSAGAFLAGLALINSLGIRRTLAYAVLGVGLWIALLKSGVHATVAGVLLAMTIPARVQIDCRQFRTKASIALAEFDCSAVGEDRILMSHENHAALQRIEDASKQVQMPLQRMEHALHPWVIYIIIPIFALANAGVSLSGGFETPGTAQIGLGIGLGLVLGKLIGVTSFSWLAVVLGLGAMPTGCRWGHLIGVGLLGGIGFTMSFFIANLAYADPAYLTAAKMGILAGSVVAGVAGAIVIVTAGPPTEETGDEGG